MTQQAPLPTAATRKPESGQGDARVAAQALQSRRLRSAELFGAEQEIEIEHGEAVYRLRRTSLGKLILTK
jgi:hemin uptake protein HemP